MLENKGRYIIDFHDFPTKRVGMPELEVEKRIDNFDEVELGLTQEDAQDEAGRCLSCRRCLGCALCLAVCEPKAIVFEQDDEVLELEFDEIIIAPEAGAYMPIEKGEYGFGECKNIIDGPAFERMLASDGPTSGYLIKPFDGDIPVSMAFVIDSADEELLAAIKSNAALALKKVSGLNITVISSDDMESIDGATVMNGNVSEVKESEGTGNISVTCGDETKEFEMLVIFKSMDILPEIKELKEKLE